MNQHPYKPGRLRPETAAWGGGTAKGFCEVCGKPKTQHTNLGGGLMSVELQDTLLEMIQAALRAAYDLGVADGKEAGFEEARRTVNDWIEPPDREC